MADRVRLPRLAFAIVETAAEFVSRLATKPIARIPEVSGARLIGNIAQHLAALAVLDFPEDLTAKLEVVTLLIDRITAVAVDQNAFLDTGDQIVQRRILWPGWSETFGMRGNEMLPQLSPCIAPIRFLLSGHRSQIARRLPVDKHAVLNQMPALAGNTFIVVTDRRQACRLRAIGDKVQIFDPNCSLPILSGVRKLVPA